MGNRTSGYGPFADPNFGYRSLEGFAVRAERQSLERSALGRDRTKEEEERYRKLCQDELRLEFPGVS
jgi:hypothetical protein